MRRGAYRGSPAAVPDARAAWASAVQFRVRPATFEDIDDKNRLSRLFTTGLTPTAV